MRKRHPLLFWKRVGADWSGRLQDSDLGFGEPVHLAGPCRCTHGHDEHEDDSRCSRCACLEWRVARRSR